MSTFPPAPAMFMASVWLALPFLAGGCALSHLVVAKAPQLQGIRTVYVSLFDSVAPHPSSSFSVTPPHPRHLRPLPNSGASPCHAPAPSTTPCQHLTCPTAPIFP